MTNNTFKYVSLFSGVGGFEQALNRLGGKCAMSSEVDKFANQAYEVLYGHKTVGDVTKVAAGDVPDHDWLVAGFPCPTFSVAGGRDGMEYKCNDCGYEHLITYEDYRLGAKCPKCSGDTDPKDVRGLLFFEVARIADAKRPKVLLLENVKGLVSSSNGEVLRVIVETLNTIGYTVDFNVLNSKYFGVPQNRERIFIVGILNDQTESWNITGNNVVAKGKRRISILEGVKTFNFDWPPQDTVTTRLRDILEDEVDERYYISEEKTAKLVAQLEIEGEPSIQKDAKMIGYANISGHDFNKHIYSVEGVSRTLNTTADIGRSVKVAEPQVVYHDLTQTVVVRKHEVDIEGLRTLLRECKEKTELTNKKLAEHFERPITEVEHWFRTDKCFSIPSANVWEELKHVLEIPTNEFDAQVTEFIEKEGVFEKAGRFYEVDGLAPTLTRTSADEKIIEPRMIGHIDLKGHDAIKRVYATDGISPTLTTMGGGHREPKIAEVRACLIPDREEKRQQGRRFKENDEPSHTINTQDRHGVAIGKYPKYRIRKLTPKECFRLQGFADSEFDKLVATGISNSQLYKMAGNAVTVNVIEAIGTRLLKYLSYNEIGSRYVTIEKGA
ncbi:DNA (cytosine-5-)-methyltransferase [Bacillus cereus]|uniref:DNA (cytosine-5-)-methyltransferase n=1 Tax=Bacillus cereus TaxID=1396 RepID=UPI001B8B0247|nr:DNA (cytosine-5-)-methyltransferase [Bacillus cereus]QUW39297.1 DNA (cytosine-5-)-methyltransferase [Bacillus cereus]